MIVVFDLGWVYVPLLVSVFSLLLLFSEASRQPTDLLIASTLFRGAPLAISVSAIAWLIWAALR